ncbi:hypothetical protein BSKO_10152 [Bryopsis sp. KO-2023]|nr:hypothetical protein BSKO_10152 [Bryopsis sp. KO-2023]
MSVAPAKVARFGVGGAKPKCLCASLSGSRCNSFGRAISGTQLRSAPTNGSKWFAARWLENSAQLEVPVPVGKCFELWSDRELIPTWMPWIHTVKVQEDETALSRWTLRTNQFGRDWEFSWLARNLTPIPQQKIHWISEPSSVGGSFGNVLELNNRGQIRFYRRSPDSCAVSLTISYELPDLLVPFVGALTPLVEDILLSDLKLFSEFAQKDLAAQK